MEPTEEEAKFIKRIKRLFRDCPNSLWFYSGQSSCDMTVMRYKEMPKPGRRWGTRGINPDTGGPCGRQITIINQLDGPGYSFLCMEVPSKDENY